MIGTYPNTIVLVHRKERREKCTVEPLRGRPDMNFHSFPLTGPIDTVGYLRLAIDGPPLSESDRDAGLLILDATWRWAADMERSFLDVPARSLPAWRTAYPRVSKAQTDPARGLATVEAIYLAYRILDRPTDGLLDAYYWRQAFLDINGVP